MFKIPYGASHSSAYTDKVDSCAITSALSGMKQETKRYRAWFGLWVADMNNRERYRPSRQANSVYNTLRSFTLPASKGYTYKCSCPDDLNVYAFTERSLLYVLDCNIFITLT